MPLGEVRESSVVATAAPKLTVIQKLSAASYLVARPTAYTLVGSCFSSQRAVSKSCTPTSITKPPAKRSASLGGKSSLLRMCTANGSPSSPAATRRASSRKPGSWRRW